MADSGKSPGYASVVEELSLGTLVLGDGARMPRLGFGTAGSTTGPVIQHALRAGLRLLDTAAYYGNEKRIVRAVHGSGIDRGEFFIVSKAWPFDARAGRDRSDKAPTVSAQRLAATVEAHIAKLNVGYLDLLLLHWPSSALVAHWNALIALRQSGRVRSIGLSNSNVRHIELLRQNGVTVLPALVQTELAPVRADARIDVEIEPLVQYCAQHSIALMSHSPIKAALKDRNTKLLAARSNVTVPQLVLRYGLQRGFAMIFSSRSPEHIESNLRVFDFEIHARHMAEMACWRGEAQCHKLSASIGAQRPARRKNFRRNYLSPSAWLSPPPADPILPMAPGEPDPVTLQAGQSMAERHAAELRAAPQLAVMPPDVAAPIGNIHAFRGRGGRGSSDRCGGLRCDFSLHVTRPSSARYAGLVRNVSAGLSDTLADPRDSYRRMRKEKGASAQHVISVRPGRGWRFATALHELLEDFVKPLLMERVFTSAPLVLRQLLASRNANDFPSEQFGRRRSMLWHYDGLDEGNIKVILYLNNVGHQNGCMVAMRHNESGEPFTVKPSALKFGDQDTLPVLPALWLSELVARGYEPECLKGAPGTLVIFDVNIVHRGSRPAAGLYRDFVLLEFCTPSRIRCSPKAGGAIPRVER